MGENPERVVFESPSSQGWDDFTGNVVTGVLPQADAPIVAVEQEDGTTVRIPFERVVYIEEQDDE